MSSNGNTGLTVNDLLSGIRRPKSSAPQTLSDLVHISPGWTMSNYTTPDGVRHVDTIDRKIVKLPNGMLEYQTVETFTTITYPHGEFAERTGEVIKSSFIACVGDCEHITVSYCRVRELHTGQLVIEQFMDTTLADKPYSPSIASFDEVLEGLTKKDLEFGQLINGPWALPPAN